MLAHSKLANREGQADTRGDRNFQYNVKLLVSFLQVSSFAPTGILVFPCSMIACCRLLADRDSNPGIGAGPIPRPVQPSPDVRQLPEYRPAAVEPSAVRG